jgi:hypothetical protein
VTRRPDRCRTRSDSLNESLHGTASTVRSWLLLEEPGPWGPDVPRDSRLDPVLAQRLQATSRRLRLRVLLIRRAGRSRSPAPTPRRCFLARTGPGEGWIEHTALDDPAHVLDLDLTGFADGNSPGLVKATHPLYLVCTHGRHDPCCAERGRPVAQALARHLPEETWEVSHIGGDRFAANLLVLPHGLYFGRVTPEDAVDLADAYARGEVDPQLLRGRAAYDFATQAAECFLRTQSGITGVDALRLVRSRRDDEETEATFAYAAGGRYRVRVRTTAHQPARTLTCRAERMSTPPEHQLVEIRHEPD